MVSVDPLPMAFDMEEHLPTLIASRCDQVRAALQPSGVGTYLLIDPMLGDPLLSDGVPAEWPLEQINVLRNEAWQRTTRALQLPTSLGLDAALAPYIVELHGTQDPWLADSVAWAVQETVHTWTAEPDQASPHRVGGWLQTSAVNDNLVERLSACLQLSARGAGHARYLRLADRRVLGLAHHVLGQARMAQALYPVARWLWLDPKTALQTIEVPPAGDPQSPSVCALREPLAQFSAAQWKTMGLGPKAHHAMATSIGRLLAQALATAPNAWPAVGHADWQAALAQVTSPQADKDNSHIQEGRHP